MPDNSMQFAVCSRTLYCLLTVRLPTDTQGFEKLDFKFLYQPIRMSKIGSQTFCWLPWRGFPCESSVKFAEYVVQTKSLYYCKRV